MELVSTMEISGEEREIADAYARGQIDGINSNLSSEISRAKETEEVLKSRIDTIASLPEGSTTGDAELQDIRVKADGTTATSAGNAVREQFSELKGDLAELSEEHIGVNRFKLDMAQSGFVMRNGNIGSNSDTFYFTISVPYGKKVVATYKNGTIRSFAPFIMICVKDYLEKGTNDGADTFTNDFSESDLTVTLTTMVVYSNEFEVNLIDKDDDRELASGKSFYTQYEDSLQIKNSAVRYVDVTTLSNYPKTVYVKKDGSGDFATIKSAIEYATRYMDSTVYVDGGTYDLFEEFGASYFASITSSSGYQGLVLKNRIKVVFSPNAKVVCNYTGGNQYAESLFAPFNSGEYGFTLCGLNLYCSKVRYGVHDERNNKTDLYVNNYKNCNIYIDNTGSSLASSRAIGGGLGKNGIINIDSCVFSNGSSSDNFVVSYHNSGNSEAKSLINITNSYIDGANKGLAFSYYGNSTKITEINVCGCSMGRSIYKYGESPSFTIDNINIREWNNVIRS